MQVFQTKPDRQRAEYKHPIHAATHQAVHRKLRCAAWSSLRGARREGSTPIGRGFLAVPLGSACMEGQLTPVVPWAGPDVVDFSIAPGECGPQVLTRPHQVRSGGGARLALILAGRTHTRRLAVARSRCAQGVSVCNRIWGIFGVLWITRVQLSVCPPAFGRAGVRRHPPGCPSDY
jgi:hypothetical protein